MEAEPKEPKYHMGDVVMFDNKFATIIGISIYDYEIAYKVKVSTKGKVDSTTIIAEDLIVGTYEDILKRTYNER